MTNWSIIQQICVKRVLFQFQHTKCSKRVSFFSDSPNHLSSVRAIHQQCRLWQASMYFFYMISCWKTDTAPSNVGQCCLMSFVLFCFLIKLDRLAAVILILMKAHLFNISVWIPVPCHTSQNGSLFLIPLTTLWYKWVMQGTGLNLKWQSKYLTWNWRWYK